MAEAGAAKAAPVRKTIHVDIPIERAFSVFTEQMGAWWPPSHHIGKEPFAAIVIEPRKGGRWLEKDAAGNECPWGYVLAWEPPNRVVVSWHLGPDWKFHPDLAKASEVEIRFHSDGPSKTRVELEHRNIERHGEGFEQLRAGVDSPGGWMGILEHFVSLTKK